jgi:hypothetical protein
MKRWARGRLATDRTASIHLRTGDSEIVLITVRTMREFRQSTCTHRRHAASISDESKRDTNATILSAAFFWLVR